MNNKNNKLRLFISIFILVFIAELGDKTQIASFSMAAKNGKILSVIIGASLALTCATLLAVIFGHLITRFVPKKLLKLLSGLLFLATGVVMLISPFFGG